MSKRYGRNQKRAARQKIAELEGRLASAKEEAFQDYARQHDMIGEAVKRIGVELGRALGPQLLPIAEKILASDRRSERHLMSPVPFELSAEVRPYDMVTVIRGEIPRLNYNFAIMPERGR